MRTADVEHGDIVVVAGFGGLGSSAVLGSLTAGAAQGIVIEPAMKLVRKLGTLAVIGLAVPERGRKNIRGGQMGGASPRRTPRCTCAWTRPASSRSRGS